jgi:orotidine-5'-phosphate decarboxylase
LSGAGASPAPDPAHQGFGDRLAAAVAARESQIVVGIDPDPAKLWPPALARTGEARARLAEALAEVERAALEGFAAPPDRTPADNGAARESRPAPCASAAARVPRFEAAAAVLAHSLALIDAAAPACVAAKPQLAFFEQLGFPGWLALELTCAHARAAGLVVLADAKRGDISSTAAAYARALMGETPTPFGTVAGLRADAITANPLLGRDALEPLVAGARTARAGVFVLVRTSNPGAADFFDLPLAGGEPLWERIAAAVDALGVPGRGASGLADVGAVTGATAPEHLARMRELMPATPFLLPGVGAQGGDVAALAPAFAPGRAAGLVTASRSIADAHEQRGGDPADAARAEAERLRAEAWALA